MRDSLDAVEAIGSEIGKCLIEGKCIYTRKMCDLPKSSQGKWRECRLFMSIEGYAKYLANGGRFKNCEHHPYS